MNWKSTFFGGRPKHYYDHIKRLRGQTGLALTRSGLSLNKALDEPAVLSPLRGLLAPHLKELLGRPASPDEIVRCKQGVVSIAADRSFIRAARQRKGMRKLHAEFAGWRRFQDAGLGHLVTPELKWADAPRGWTLLINRLLERQPQEAFLPSMARIVPPLVRNAELTGKGVPLTVATGHELVRQATEGQIPEQLPSVQQLEQAFASSYPVGLFHRDLHNGNVLLYAGRPVFSDLKSCLPDRIVDLDLIHVIAYHYPGIKRQAVTLMAMEAERDGWCHPDVAPLVSLVTLPRSLWAGIYFYHAMGVAAGVKSGRTVPAKLRSLMAKSSVGQFLEKISQ